MGIKIVDDAEILEDSNSENEIPQNIQSGIYNMESNMGSYPINWYLDLTSNTITINILNKPDLGAKIINENNPIAEFRIVHFANVDKFSAKISSDFQIKQLSLNGQVRYRIHGGMHPAYGTKKYENIVLTTW